MARAALLFRVGAACCVALALGSVGLASAAPEARSKDRSDSVWILSIKVSQDYEHTRTIYSVRRRRTCERNCRELLRSTDGGRTWEVREARRWAGMAMFVTRLEGEEVLLSSGPAGIQVSRNGGTSFHTYPAPEGRIDVAPERDGGLAILISGTYGRYYLYRLPSRRLMKVTGSRLGQAQLVFHPAYPKVPVGQPHALAAGTDRASDLPVIERCDERFACSGGTVVVPSKDFPRVFPSPSFGRDHTLFVATVQGRFLRSSDAGATFAPVAVTVPAGDQIISTVQALAFSHDFDATERRGRVSVGLLSVSGKPGGAGRVTGGVYTSRDAGASWSKVGRRSQLDAGVTALAAPPDGRLLAAHIDMSRDGRGGILCTTDLRQWRRSCPAYRSALQEQAQGRNGSAAAASATVAPGGEQDAVGAVGGAGSSRQPARRSPARRRTAIATVALVAAAVLRVLLRHRRSVRASRLSPAEAIRHAAEPPDAGSGERKLGHHGGRREE